MNTFFKYHLIFLLFTAFTLTFLSSCQKGEEDPAISLRSRKDRVEGEWRATQIDNSESYSKEYTDGTDSISVTSVSFDGNTFTRSFEISSETDMEEKEQKGTSTGTAQVSYTLGKNGDFVYVITTDLKVNITESGGGFFTISYTSETVKTEKITQIIRGKWSFLGGNDEIKNKSNIAITYSEEEIEIKSSGHTKYNYSNTDTTLYFDINNVDYITHNASIVTQVWELEKLANKEMVVNVNNRSTGYGSMGYNEDNNKYTINSLTSSKMTLSQD